MCVCVSCSVMSESLRPHRLWPIRLLCLWDFPGKNTGVDCHSFLQRNFPTQGSNPGLLHHRQVKGHQPLHEGPTLVISSDASHFPKAPPPNAVTVQAGLQHVNHGVQAMQSIAPPFLTTNIISTSDTLQASHHSSNSIFFLWLPWWLRQ